MIGRIRDATGIDIRLSRQRRYRVSGTVIDSRGQPLRDALINYMYDTETGNRAGVGLAAGPDGRFVLPGLSAGEYELDIRSVPEDSGLERDKDGEYARQTLVVQADVDDLVIVTRPTATVTGEIVFKGASAAVGSFADLQVGALPVNDRAEIAPPSMATVREDQRFALRGLAGACLIRKMSEGPLVGG